ncbi:MAG: MlaA family lipoprotein [Fusobacterium sp.]|nr:MlaA family lipoprotein [Fusobacterium sp.]
MKRIFIITAILLSLATSASGEELTKQQSKYPDYGYMYLGPDKFEKLNRKMFAFNLGLNKYAVRPVHILWSSIMPEYGMDRIHSAYKNIEYPKRLVSSLIQKDFKTSGQETVRFLTNSTLGLGGMFDPAKRFFHLEPTTEDMEQALTRCKCCSGPFVVLPGLAGATTRGMAGRVLDMSLNPTTYVGTPVLAMVKAGLTVNRTSYMQPLIKMIESTYADPYEIARKMYGLDSYIKSENFDRKHVLENGFKQSEEPAELVELRGLDTCDDELILVENNTPSLDADMILPDYNPQCPVVDSMRTALFDLPDVDSSIWNELSIWNRSFSKKIKTSSVSVTPDRDDYKFRYILQKDKSSPIAIIYPSIGEGIQSHHSVILAKMFYDAGYSVVIQGSHFQWEYVKSMPDDYRPGLPAKDAEYLKNVTAKIVQKLETKYDCKFGEKTILGTSLGAMMTLFVANSEYKDDTLGVTKYISICPPIELTYALEQVDKNGEEWFKNPNDLKNRVAQTASKVVQLSDMKDEQKDFKIGTLPFTEEEGKLITGFVMHQKLSDLIFTLEKTPKTQATGIYDVLNNMNYHDYMEKYFIGQDYRNVQALSYDTSLLSLAPFLKNSSNYKIYHAVDDYLVNQKQLKNLKAISGSKTVLLSNGAHLGFMYTPEFIKSLNNEILLAEK